MMLAQPPVLADLGHMHGAAEALSLKDKGRLEAVSHRLDVPLTCAVAGVAHAQGLAIRLRIRY